MQKYCIQINIKVSFLVIIKLFKKSKLRYTGLATTTL